MISSKYIILLFLSIATLGYAQDSDRPQRKFDIKKFDENKAKVVGVYEWSYETADSTYLLQQGRGAAYLETVTLKGTTLKKAYSYYKSGKLENTQEIYYSINVGKTRLYNEQGVLINEVNEDDKYDFTMEDVRRFLIKKFEIDIRDANAKQAGVDITRHSFQLGFDGIPTYTIFVPTKFRYVGERLVLDGATGTILSHKDENDNELTKDSVFRKEHP